MSARSFRSVGWVAGVAATALGCYMVNLKVASERAALEDVETRIVLAQRDIRLLQTEIGTRGRLAQLEKWNVKVLALSAPAANQFMDGSFQLATLVAPQKVLDPAAPVVLASAPVPAHQPLLSSDGAVAAPVAPSGATELLHTASLKRATPATMSPALRRLKPETAAKPKPETAARPKPVPAADKKLASSVKPRAKSAVDPLAPMPEVKTAAAVSKSPPRLAAKAKAKPAAAVTAKPKAKEAQAKQ